MTSFSGHLGTIINRLPLDTRGLMKLIEEVVITYLGGGQSDDHHQGRLGRFFAIGAGELRLMFL